MKKVKFRINPVLLVVMFAVYISIYNYYQFIIPSMENVLFFIYQIGRLFFSLLFVEEIFSIFNKKYSDNKKYTRPFYLIVFFLVLNYVVIAISEGDFTFLSKNYQMIKAEGTNDFIGYYFSNLITWTGNCGISIWLINRINDNKTIIKSLKVCLWMIIIPIILLMLLHPEYIGQRISDLETTNFGGGIWNIGVFGFCSFAWLTIMCLPFMTNREKRFSYFALIILIFAGIVGLSRSFILTVFLSFIYYFFQTSKTANKLLKNVMLFLLIILSVALLYNIYPNIFESLLGRFHDSTSGTHNVRFLLWKNYFSNIKEYFIFGAPLGGPYNYYHNLSYKGFYYLPHSSVINYLITFGIGGLICYISFLTKIYFSKGIFDNQMKSCLKAMIIAYIILAFINQTGFNQIIFFVSFGIALAFIKINKKNESEKNENRNNN